MKQKILKSLLISLMIMVLPFAVSANDVGNELKTLGIIDEDFDKSPGLPVGSDPIVDTADENDSTMGSGGPPQNTTDVNSGVIPDSDYMPSPGSSGVPPQNTTTTITPPPGGAVTPVNNPATGSGATGPWKEGLSKAEAQGLPGGAISDIIFNLASWLLLILGSFALIGFAISGILYLTSAGEEDRMEKAKKGMIYSIIGVIVGLLGYVIVQAVDTWLRGGIDTF